MFRSFAVDKTVSGRPSIERLGGKIRVAPSDSSDRCSLLCIALLCLVDSKINIAFLFRLNGCVPMSRACVFTGRGWITFIIEASQELPVAAVVSRHVP